LKPLKTKSINHFEQPHLRLRCHARQALARSVKRDTPDLPSRPPPHTKINNLQDKQLCAFVQRLIQWNFPPRLDFIRDYANIMLAHVYNQSGIPSIVGKNWPDRWVARHPEFAIRNTKPIDNRRSTRHNKEDITDFFKTYLECIQDYGIVEGDIYNMDESGFQVGCGKRSKVITLVT